MNAGSCSRCAMVDNEMFLFYTYDKILRDDYGEEKQSRLRLLKMIQRLADAMMDVCKRIEILEEKAQPPVKRPDPIVCSCLECLANKREKEQ